MKKFLLLILSIPLTAVAQHDGQSYRLSNETGTFWLTSHSYSKEKDSNSGQTFVTDRQGNDTLYTISTYLNGHVALSRNGRTVAHLISQENGVPIEKSNLTFYRNGKEHGTASFHRLLSYGLEEAEKNSELHNGQWWKNDSILHKMATHPFYISDDRLFISFEGPLLMVFEMDQMYHIYSGNGANHFFQNYYAIPAPPYREIIKKD